MPKHIVLTATELKRRADIVRAVTARTDIQGLTRPARAPDKRAILERRGGLGPFVETTIPRSTNKPGTAGPRKAK